MSERMRDERLEAIRAMSQRAVADRTLHLTVPELLAEIDRLRDLVRWRVVGDEPPDGHRVLLETDTGPCTVTLERDDNGVDLWQDADTGDVWDVDPADRWLPIPFLDAAKRMTR